MVPDSDHSDPGFATTELKGIIAVGLQVLFAFACPLPPHPFTTNDFCKGYVSEPLGSGSKPRYLGQHPAAASNALRQSCGRAAPRIERAKKIS